jgi:RNA polymerase sigma-70 factor (ECF subfamily)
VDVHPIFAGHTAVPGSPRRAEGEAFERLVGPLRPALQAHCYRMLGSAADAEDALQETLLRAWRGLPSFEGRSALSSWLYRIATNVCLRMIERRPRRLVPIDAGPPGRPEADPPPAETVWLEPYPDDALGGPTSPEARYEQRESVELAFAAALQHLPARQRAVLLLRDVLGFAPAEIAAVLGTTPAAVSSALQRARAAVEQRLPAASQQTTLRMVGDERLRMVVEHYARAWEAGDVAAITAMLTADATLAMPPMAAWYRGREAIGAFLAEGPMARPGRWRHLPVSANGHASLAVYEVAGDRATAHVIELLTLEASGAISAVTAFIDPAPFARFGLPAEIDGSGPSPVSQRA